MNTTLTPLKIRTFFTTQLKAPLRLPLNLSIFIALIGICSPLHANGLALENDCRVYGTSDMSDENSHSVQSYKSELTQCQIKSGESVISLRSFQLDDTDTNLIVDPKNLQTHIVLSSCLKSCKNITAAELMVHHYGELLGESMAAPYPTHNDGIIVGKNNSKELALTIDMCPSQKGISSNVYNKIVQVAEQTGNAFPVGIAMTKKWMQKYPTHFRWLKQMHQEGKIDILWINHSDTHPYNKNSSDENNFLLSPGVDFTKEVLGTEIALIKAGVTPSLFFRFPGLVSSQTLIEKLENWGLVALGSKAWLAKGEKPKAQSIILIHGNKNEPAGEKLFINYVETKTSDLAWASLLNLLDY
ncbi:MAG: polysaccharide deacetylase family protein [Bdellovibrionaceae bacterium]|nr:polysaccharide deacetylase family protein [Pseudobdellovibrionaceae bacterium]